MKVQEKDIYHGAALTQIVEHPSFKALNRASPKYGHYLVNTDRQVFVKYRTKRASPWQFTFQPDELSALSEAFDSGDKVYLCLVCDGATVCALNKREIARVVDVAADDPQYIRVQVPRGGRCHVNGSAGALGRAVPHNAFPEKVFK